MEMCVKGLKQFMDIVKKLLLNTTFNIEHFRKVQLRKDQKLRRDQHHCRTTVPVVKDWLLMLCLSSPLELCGFEANFAREAFLL